MAFKGLLLAVVLLIAAVTAAPTAIFTVSTISTTELGVTSDRVLITASDNVDGEYTVTATSVDGNELSLSAYTFSFTPTVRQLSFTASSLYEGTHDITFAVSPDAQFAAPATTTLSFRNRTYTVDSFSSEVTYVNEWSEPKRIELSTVSSSTLSFTPIVGNSSIIFVPATIVVAAGARSATFHIYSQDEIVSDEITWAVTGTEANLYTTSDVAQTVAYAFALRPFEYSSLSKNVLVGYTGTNGFYVYTRHLPNQTFTITPQAADTVFSPPSAAFGPSQQSVLFTFNTASAGNRQVYLFSNGLGALDYELNPLDSASLTVPKRQVGVAIAGQHVITNSSYISISLAAPVANELTVTFSAGKLRFNVTSVTFTPKNNLTSVTVGFQAAAFGADTITFALSGSDAANYLQIPPLSIPAFAIEQANFIFAEEYYTSGTIENLFVNVRSPRIPIRASISPITEVILQPTAPGLIFEPAQISFKNGSEQQYFNIFPTYSSSYLSSGRANFYTTTINWLVIGKDAPSYVEPAPISVSVYPRSFQAVWSAHLITDASYTSSDRHLHKTYKVWVSTNYIQSGEHVSVTPVSPFFKFSPSVLFFDADHTRIELEATLTGIPIGGAARIDYVLGGQDGGLYSPPGFQTVNAALRPLAIVAAVVSPDERNTGVYIGDNRTNPNPTDPLPFTPYAFKPAVLTSYHVSSFLIRSFVLPDQDITIIPSSPHLKFSPSKITIKARSAVKRIDWHTAVLTSSGADANYPFNVTGVYLEANFTVEALAPGTHVVKFELQGGDKDYYQRIPNTPMTFRLVSRPDSEPFKVSSSSFLFPSVVVAVMAALALVL